MSKTKFNVAIGVLTGVLVGFVFGAVFGTPGAATGTTGGKAAGNIANVSEIRKSLIQPSALAAEPSDTLNLTATDENGNEMQIIIIK